MGSFLDRHRSMVTGVAVTAVLMGIGTLFSVGEVQAQRAAREGEWPSYAGQAGAWKYSPLTQIDAGNVKDLRVAWRWASPDRDLQQSSLRLRASRYEDTPLMINGVLYTVTPLGMVAAIDPGTGQTRWVFDPESHKNPRPVQNVGWLMRGLAFWTDGTRERIIDNTIDAYLISLDAKTGKPDPEFGSGGRVDLTEGTRNAVRSKTLMGGRGTLVAGDVFIVSTMVADPQPGQEGEMPPGDVKAFDARTGKLRWTFHTIPHKGEAGYETWLEDSAERTGNANVWSGMSWDSELDYVYMATSSAGADGYGGFRPGDNLFSETIICLEAKTGK